MKRCVLCLCCVSLFVGCVYKVPVTTSHRIAINDKVLGSWTAVPDAEGDVDVARRDRREPDRRVLEKPELGHRESPARKVEPGVGEPGDAKDPPAPALVDRVPPRRSYGLTRRSSLRWR